MADFQELVTLTLTLDRVILHTIMHHSSTSTYTPNFIEIEEAVCGRTDERTYERADGHLGPTLLGRLGGVDLKIKKKKKRILNCTLNRNNNIINHNIIIKLYAPLFIM